LPITINSDTTWHQRSRPARTWKKHGTGPTSFLHHSRTRISWHQAAVDISAARGEAGGQYKNKKCAMHGILFLAKEEYAMKKTVFAILAVFVTWSALDFVIHVLILGSTYAAMPQLWRPMAQMKMGLMYFTVLVVAASFVYIYARFIAEKGVRTAVLYGVIFGIATGVGMGYGTYSVMPIPYSMAFVWFIGSVVEFTIGGLITGMIIKK